jgi:glycosyltransferase involved in cell wall biosynthesis
LTLPDGVTHAEGFSLWETGVIRKIGIFSVPFQNLHRLEPAPGEAGPLVSVIVRTKDRPSLLANALKSIVQQTYANLEIVVVNDGGQDVRDVVNALAGNIPVVYIHHDKSRGRSAAANSALKAAHGSYLNFLDDDDVFYPNHVEGLVSYLLAKEAKVAYSSVLNVYFNGPPNMPENRAKEELIFNFDFDPDRLLFENYIPLMSILFSRDVLPCVEGFYDDMVLFEDWDFLVRISRHFTFHHIDKVTAEYRFYGVTNMEKSHRQKYRYDEARAMIFDRVLPFLTGKAWVNFLNGGSLDRLKHDTLNGEAKQSEPEQAMRNYQATALQKEEELTYLKGQCDGLLNQNEDLKNRHYECREALERIQRHLAYRAYRKIKDLMGHRG